MNWVYIPPIDMEWEADAKVRSKDNIDHVPSGGNVTIESNPVKWKADAKVKSLDEKHMAMVEKVRSAPKKDHVKWIKLPPTIPASKYKHVEYTRNGVYAIVEPVKIEARSKVDFSKPKNVHQKNHAASDIDVTRRIKLTKNARVDNYNMVEQTASGNYVVVDPIKIEAKPKIDFPKPDFVSTDSKKRPKSDKVKHKYPFF